MNQDEQQPDSSDDDYCLFHRMSLNDLAQSFPKWGSQTLGF
jgi:hypothetical protein